MSLAMGARVGQYEVVSHLGQGGMGVVYRALDTVLRRQVALKTLPDHLSSDRDRMARFKREAHALASLNHPNIAQIYGFEEAGDKPYLVMEFVEGETLQQRLARGPLTVPDALRAARQLAEALETAHEHGIVHRDLKPANVQLTRDDQVKVLDFGLAKALHDGSLDRSDGATSVAGTEAGMILGTAAFMAPEQAKGKAVDRRADIWAYGAIVYQMLTGREAFAGETTSETIAAVMLKEPEWEALPPDAPPRLAELLRRCLIKDPRNRLQAIGDARIAIDEMLGGVAGVSSSALPVSRSRRFAFGAGALVVIALAVVTVSLFSREAEPTVPVTRWTVQLADGERVAFGRFAPLGVGRTSVALSPDGRNLVYAAERIDGTQLYLRPLDAFDARPIPGTEGAYLPFFSPDGQSVGFFTGSQLKRVLLAGGSPVALAEATHALGASWASDGYVYYADREANLLRRVPANGGSSTVVASWADTGTQMRSVHVLPGAHALLYDEGVPGTIKIMHLPEAKVRPLVSGTNGKYVAGHIVFSRGSDVFVAAFDLERLELAGPAVPVLENVRTEAESAAQLAVSDGGTLAYVSGGFERRTNFVWVDRGGGHTPIDTPTQLHGPLDLSPDGQRVAVEIFPQAEGQLSAVWIYDLERNTASRLASGASRPFWSADGNDLHYIAERDGKFRIMRQAADGIGGAQELASGMRFMHGAAAPDGSALVLSQISTYGDMNLWWLPLGNSSVLEPFLETPAWDGFPAFSPDGRWLAYSSDESGRYEVYVVSTDQSADRRQRRQISPDGGEEPRWSPSGELFYRSGQRWMVVAVTDGAELTAGRPALLFEGPFHNTPGFSYDASPDGQRVLVLREAVPSDGRQIRIVENWFSEMRQRIATSQR
jgi:eukaryotic-like serine/threonine-protein kinase